jgi:hypothetical protein
MQVISPPRPSPSASLIGGTLLGAGLVAAGLGVAYMTLETPFVSRLLVVAHPGPSHLAVPPVVWLLALVAGAGLLVAGANRLAVTVASVRSGGSGGSALARASRQLPAEVVVVGGAVARAGHPVAQLVIGPFGVAVVHEMDPHDGSRHVGRAWETKTSAGWAPTEHPIERLARDAERVRHWLTNDDLDFVVRVYAALITSDATIERSLGCAVITAEQIPAWLVGLPRQRSLSEGRRARLLARLGDGASHGGVARDW